MAVRHAAIQRHFRHGLGFRNPPPAADRLGDGSRGVVLHGQFALFTYIRPFLEGITGVGASTLSSLLLIMGVAGLLGTYLIGFVLKTRLYSVLIAMPLAMAVIAVALTALGGSAWSVAGLLGGWGLIGTAAPVGWWTWLSRTLPHDAERGAV